MIQMNRTTEGQSKDDQNDRDETKKERRTG
jgi:hypothetical protein